MKMNKMFAGLIAFVAGVALSAGSAFATKGYMGGDPARMKLVPYYETGEMRATIIGIQNLSGQEAATMAAHAAVTAAQTALNADDGADRNETARLMQNLTDAQDAIYTEHVFIAVNVYDAMGMMMGSATLCLAEHQFGYVVLQGAESMMMDHNRGAVLSAMEEDIPASGYVKVMAEDRKFTNCGVNAPNELVNVDTRTAAQIADTTADLVATVRGANSQVATWTIIQDTGDGFFGTEVPTGTISMESALSVSPNEDGDYLSAGDGTDNNAIADDAIADGAKIIMLDAERACYTDTRIDGTTADAEALRPNLTAEAAGVPAMLTPGQLDHTEGDFVPERCGLIPERHYMLLNADGTLDKVGLAADTPAVAGDSSTMNAHAFARYDAGDDSMIMVWLAKGMDMEDTKPTDRRMLNVVVKCEDGTVVKDMTADGDPTDIKIPAPTMITMIDPNGDALGDFTDMCMDGDRGTLQIEMPDNSHAGMVFTHISQMMDHYRMNFPGYSMASMTEIDMVPAP